MLLLRSYFDTLTLDDLRNLIHRIPRLSERRVRFLMNIPTAIMLKLSMLQDIETHGFITEGLDEFSMRTPRLSIRSPRKARKLTAYNKFVKKHMKDSNLNGLDPRDKMRAIADMWKNK
jgi:hypothetical protein